MERGLREQRHGVRRSSPGALLLLALCSVITLSCLVRLFHGSRRSIRQAPAIMEKAPESMKALIFDCDGTLVDTETPYLKAFNNAVAIMRGDAPGTAPAVDPEQWGRECSGRGLEYDSRYAVQTFGLNGTMEEFLALWKKQFEPYNLTNEAPGTIPLLPGFDELYAFARSRGMKIAVASSSDGAGLRRKILNGVVANTKLLEGLEGFDTIVSNDDVTRHKPDPEIYLLAASRLGVKPEDCWVVEDTATGVMAGKNAKMKVAAVPNQFTRMTNDFSHADVVLETMDKLIPLLEGQ